MISLLPLAFLLLCVNVRLTEAQSKEFDLPVILPPFNMKDTGETPDIAKDVGHCLLYLEGLGIMIFQGKDSAGNQPKAWGAVIDSLSKKNKFTWDKSFVDCKNITMDPIKSKDEVRTFSFTIKIKPTSPIDAKHGETVLFTIPTDDISLILRFRTILGSGWQLYDIEAASAIKVTGTWQAEIKKGAHAANFSVDGLAIGTYNGYSYACGTTKAARFATDEGKNEYKLGVFFNNLQVQPFGYYVDDKKQVHFSRNTTDCVGTFTHGSFMGIIVALVLATVLLFGFLMLNSVQTVDRFDDPKQKQLVINAKE